MHEKWARERTMIDYSTREYVEFVPQIVKAKYLREDVQPGWIVTYFHCFISNQSEEVSASIPSLHDIPSGYNNRLVWFSATEHESYSIYYRYY